MDKVYFAARWDKGTADYINCPFTKEEYDPSSTPSPPPKPSPPNPGNNLPACPHLQTSLID